MINFLKKYFSHDKASATNRLNSLAIQYGVEGARLSHDHSTQFLYVCDSSACRHQRVCVWFDDE